MKASVVTSDPRGWFGPFARTLAEGLSRLADVALVYRHEEVGEGDLAFYLSYERLVPEATLRRNRSNVVAHASALPDGRGMSPLTWQIIEGRNVIPITLFEAVPDLDAGPVYLRDELHFDGTELLPELRQALGRKIVEMCTTFASGFPDILATATRQVGDGTRYRRRSPRDSELDPHRSLAEQFDLLRVVDNDRYPAFFTFRGRRYVLTIEGEER